MLRPTHPRHQTVQRPRTDPDEPDPKTRRSVLDEMYRRIDEDLADR